jgi:hypothetical protein
MKTNLHVGSKKRDIVDSSPDRTVSRFAANAAKEEKKQSSKGFVFEATAARKILSSSKENSSDVTNRVKSSSAFRTNSISSEHLKPIISRDYAQSQRTYKSDVFAPTATTVSRQVKPLGFQRQLQQPLKVEQQGMLSAAGKCSNDLPTRQQQQQQQQQQHYELVKTNDRGRSLSSQQNLQLNGYSNYSKAVETGRNGSDNEGGCQTAHRNVEGLRMPTVAHAMSANGAVNTAFTFDTAPAPASVAESVAAPIPAPAPAPIPAPAPAPVPIRLPMSTPAPVSASVSVSVSVPVRVPSTMRAPVSVSASMLMPASLTQSEFKIHVPSSSASAPVLLSAPRPIVNNDNFIRCNMKNRGGSSKACRPTSSLAAKMKRRKSIGERRELSREHDRKSAIVHAENHVHGRQNSYSDSRQNSYTVGSTGSQGGLRQGGSENQGEGQVRSRFTWLIN